MRDNSLRFFSLDGDPVLSVDCPDGTPRFTLMDTAEQYPQLNGVDFYAPNADIERLRRATQAFNQVMREPVENREAAE